MLKELRPNDAQDVDLFVSYERPYWPVGERSIRDNSHLGPLANDAGMWLTAMSFHRSLTTSPIPEKVMLPLPGPDEQPIRMMSGGPILEEPGEMYWFLETITSRSVAEAIMPS